MIFEQGRDRDPGFQKSIPGPKIDPGPNADPCF